MQRSKTVLAEWSNAEADYRFAIDRYGSGGYYVGVEEDTGDGWQEHKLWQPTGYSTPVWGLLGWRPRTTLALLTAVGFVLGVVVGLLAAGWSP